MIEGESIHTSANVRLVGCTYGAVASPGEYFGSSFGMRKNERTAEQEIKWFRRSVHFHPGI